MAGKQKISKRCPEINFLVQFFRECANEGKFAYYEKMAEIVNCKPDDLLGGRKYRSWVDQAKDRCKRDYGLLFQSDPGVGYAIVEDRHKPARIAKLRTSKIRSQVHLMKTDLQTVNVAKLDEQGRTDFNSATTKLAFFEYVVEVKTQDHLAAMAQSEKIATQKSREASQKETIRKLLEMNAG